MEGSDIALEALCDFLNAVEAGVEAARRTIKNAKRIDEEKLDFSKLLWEEKQGEKGLFQQTSEKANQDSILWQQLKAKVKQHNGFWQDQGFRFWFDLKNENVIDRRAVG